MHESQQAVKNIAQIVLKLNNITINLRLCGFIGLCSEMLNDSYRQPLCGIITEDSSFIQFDEKLIILINNNVNTIKS